MAVFVLDKRKKPLMPCSEKRARLLLERGRARGHRMVPFTIRLVDRLQEDSVLQPVRLKLDPGSKTTGMALVRAKETVDASTGEVLRAAAVLMLLELQHRGHAIRDTLTSRRAFRRRRRGNLRYRPVRFDSRTRPAGWLAPSLQHRVDTTLAWVSRLRRLSPVTVISQELVRFDTQALQNPEISGVEYQQGTLFGYEVREYLLEKWRRACAYCEVSGVGSRSVPLNIEHIRAKARGGTNRVSNLTLACVPCNQAKDARSVEEFLTGDPERLRRILAQAKAPLKDAAAVNTTRWALWRELVATDLPVFTASGGRTKWNRSRFGLPKSHTLDALCVGEVSGITSYPGTVLAAKATGRGSYARTRPDAYGFPRLYLPRTKVHHGFVTGDHVRAVVPKGKYAGTHVGRVAVRSSGRFDIKTKGDTVQGIGHRHCVLLQRADGWGYEHREEVGPTARVGLSLPTAEAGGFSSHTPVR